MEDADRAYVAGLKMLGQRELSEAQVRTRLARRQFEADDIDAAVTRLRRERALDDRRTALACARTEVRILSTSCWSSIGRRRAGGSTSHV